MKNAINLVIPAIIACLLATTPAIAWKNGPDGHGITSTPSDCSNPPYGTHDYIADKALEALPEKEGQWLKANKAYFLLGTEAPDNKPIPPACKTPNPGYKDMGQNNHSVRWNADLSNLTRAGAAIRAQEEYARAVEAYKAKKFTDAAYYLGAMSHYIGDVSSYPHTIENAVHHSEYESWANKRFKTFDIHASTLEKRTPYDAVVNISRTVIAGKGKILPASEMDMLWDKKNTVEYKESVAETMSLASGELADVLHNFYLNVVVEQH